MDTAESIFLLGDDEVDARGIGIFGDLVCRFILEGVSVEQGEERSPPGQMTVLSDEGR